MAGSVDMPLRFNLTEKAIQRLKDGQEAVELEKQLFDERSRMELAIASLMLDWASKTRQIDNKVKGEYPEFRYALTSLAEEAELGANCHLRVADEIMKHKGVTQVLTEFNTENKAGLGKKISKFESDYKIQTYRHANSSKTLARFQQQFRKTLLNHSGSAETANQRAKKDLKMRPKTAVSCQLDDIVSARENNAITEIEDLLKEVQDAEASRINIVANQSMRLINAIYAANNNFGERNATLQQALGILKNANPKQLGIEWRKKQAKITFQSKEYFKDARRISDFLNGVPSERVLSERVPSENVGGDYNRNSVSDCENSEEEPDADDYRLASASNASIVSIYTHGFQGRHCVDDDDLDDATKEVVQNFMVTTGHSNDSKMTVNEVLGEKGENTKIPESECTVMRAIADNSSSGNVRHSLKFKKGRLIYQLFDLGKHSAMAYGYKTTAFGKAIYGYYVREAVQPV